MKDDVGRMKVIDAGNGELFMDPDPEAARAFFREKSRAQTDKVLTVAEAVRRFVHDGYYLASGGFGTNRIATAVLHEIVRQKKRNLGFAGHTATHDFQILAAGTTASGRPPKGHEMTFAALCLRVSVPSIARRGRNGTPMDAARKRQARA